MRRRVAGFVDVGLRLKVLDTNVGNILETVRSLKPVGVLGSGDVNSYVNVKVAVHQNLELEVLCALIAHLKRRL